MTRMLNHLAFSVTRSVFKVGLETRFNGTESFSIVKEQGVCLVREDQTGENESSPLEDY